MYDVVPFENNNDSINDVFSLYGDSYMNYMFVPVIQINEISMKAKLNKIISEGNRDGITLWKVIRKDTKALVGITGLTYIDGSRKKIEITYGAKVGGIINKICEELMKFAFEDLNIDCLYGRCLSYNYFSQLIGKSIGMIEDGIENCPNDYIKDSYWTMYKFDINNYNSIKSINGGKYKISKFSKRFTKLEDLHSKARSIYDAKQFFKDTNQIERYKYLKGLQEFLEERYPMLFNKNK